MDIIRSYKRNIVENKNIIFIATLIGFAVRLLIFYVFEQKTVDQTTNGYLWNSQIIDYLYNNNLLSFTLSTVCTLAIVFYSTLINTKYKLIRNQTYLVYGIVIISFSISSVFTYMNSQYIALLLLLVAFDLLMSSYSDTKASFKAYTMGFVLASSSLFSLFTLAYIPIFWIGLKYMRCLNIKNILASILGIITIYWIAFFYFLWQNNTDAFWEPFTQFYPILRSNLETSLATNQMLFVTISSISLIVLIINYQIVSYQDKIQARINLYLIFTVCVYSFIGLTITTYDSILNLFIFTLTGSLLFAHFFSLADKKWIVSLFYIIITTYGIYSIYLLLQLV